MKLRSLILALIFLAGIGCAVQKLWVPTSGSRADGVIKLSYDYGLFEQPKVDSQQGLTVASSRCQAWGYESAEAFGGAFQVCINFSNSGCNAWRVTSEYQCTGKLKS